MIFAKKVVIAVDFNEELRDRLKRLRSMRFGKGDGCLGPDRIGGVGGKGFAQQFDAFFIFPSAEGVGGEQSTHHVGE